MAIIIKGRTLYITEFWKMARYNIAWMGLEALGVIAMAHKDFAKQEQKGDECIHMQSIVILL